MPLHEGDHPLCPNCGSEQTDVIEDLLDIEPTTAECHDCGHEWTDEKQKSDDDDDFPRCEHKPTAIEVRNLSQIPSLSSTLPMAMSLVCSQRCCILDAMAWAERTTGERAMWRLKSENSDQTWHAVPPWWGVDAELPEYPLNRDAARPLMDDEGYAEFVIEVPLALLFEAAASNSDDWIVEDALHERALSFGSTYDSRWRILSAEGETAVIEYSTNVAEALAQYQEDEDPE